MFGSPWRVHTFLLGVQGLVAASQLVLVLHSTGWNVYWPMLLFNYAILYLCLALHLENKKRWWASPPLSLCNNLEPN